MRVCLIGDCSGYPDEGMKKITQSLQTHLSRSHTVMTLSPFDVWHRQFWRQIHRFSPDVIHYVPGPSIWSFSVAKGLMAFRRRTPVVMSTPLPLMSPITLQLARFMRPSGIITQSDRYGEVFSRMGFNVIRCPVAGVDVETFLPMPERRRAVVRRSLGVKPDSFVILHVGHIKKGRNVEVLGSLQEDPGNQVVIIGSTSTGTDSSLLQRLVDLGCILVTTYVQDISEVYASADCYVFPVVNEKHSIQTPLSVLEAMSCNCPVISTRFGALHNIFQECRGLWFIDNHEEFSKCSRDIINCMKTSRFVPDTRKEVLKYSWNLVAENLSRVYCELLDSSA